MSLLTTKESYRKRAILRALLQLYVDHSTIEAGLSLADVSTTLSLSLAHTEAVVETLLSEGYLYETIDDEHHAAPGIVAFFCGCGMPKKTQVCGLSGSRHPSVYVDRGVFPEFSALSNQRAQTLARQTY